MLAKKYRLPGYLIPLVSQKGKTQVTSLFVLKYLSTSTIELLNHCAIGSLSNSLAAFIFSKKLDKRAVVRNQAKRRLSEAVRQILPQIKQPSAVIFFAKKDILSAKYQVILQEVEKTIKQLNNETIQQ